MKRLGELKEKQKGGKINKVVGRKLIRQKPLPGGRRRRRIRKRVIKRIRRAFPLATTPLGRESTLTDL